MSLIPNTRQASYMTQRQIKRSQQQQIKKIEKKFGKNLPMPTEDDMAEYIKQKTQQTEWQTKQEEKQTN
jgi:hypothetical protein